jgi:hypothetical protein
MESTLSKFISIQIKRFSVEAMDASGNIFEQLSRSIRRCIGKSYQFPLCETSDDFLDAFSKDTIFQCPVGLIIDEFDILMNHKELLSTFRLMKQNAEKFCVKVNLKY